MKYRIVSPRLGTPGELYEPQVWVNIDHLLKNGFIEPAHTDSGDTAPEPEKPATNKTSRKPKE
jgi:hypothetical protein